MKRIILTKTHDTFHYTVVESISKASGMSPKAVLKAGVELLYQNLKEKQRGQSEGGTADVEP